MFPLSLIQKWKIWILFVSKNAQPYRPVVKEQEDSNHRGHVMSLPALDVINNLTPPSSNRQNITDGFL